MTDTPEALQLRETVAEELATALSREQMRRFTFG